MPNRIVIAGKIDPLSAAQFMEAPDFQDVFINSPGGDVMSGLACTTSSVIPTAM